MLGGHREQAAVLTGCRDKKPRCGGAPVVRLEEPGNIAAKRYAILFRGAHIEILN